LTSEAPTTVLPIEINRLLPVFLVSASTYHKLNAIYCEDGRFFNPADDNSRRKVAVVGPSLVKQLDIKGSPVGEYIGIAGEWFKVIV